MGPGLTGIFFNHPKIAIIYKPVLISRSSIVIYHNYYDSSVLSMSVM